MGGIQVAGEEVKTIWQSRNGCPVGPTFFEDEKGRPYRTFKSIDVNGRSHRSLKTQEPPNGGSAPLHPEDPGGCLITYHMRTNLSTPTCILVNFPLIKMIIF